MRVTSIVVVVVVAVIVVVVVVVVVLVVVLLELEEEDVVVVVDAWCGVAVDEMVTVHRMPHSALASAARLAMATDCGVGSSHASFGSSWPSFVRKAATSVCTRERVRAACSA